MKDHLFLLVAFSLLTQLSAQAIFDANIHTAVGFGSVNFPAMESPQQVIDQDANTKYLDFNASDGIGFEVDLLGVAHIATSMEFVTANDVPQRDPLTYEVLGSNDGVDFISIATGEIPCLADRFTSRTFSFENANAYTFYRLNFTGFCDPTNINQIADVQLYSLIGNAPTLSCPADTIMVNTSVGECTGVPVFTVTAEDMEDGALEPSLIAGFESGEAFPIGTSQVAYSVTDSDGNIRSCNFTVTVVDEEDPVAGCPADTTIYINVDEDSAILDYMLQPTDNCSPINPKENFVALGSIDGNAYYLSNTGFLPLDALFDAEDNNGVMGTIRSAEDNAYLNAAILRIINLEILIGYSDINSEGNFEWLSGDPSTYTNWNMGEPNDAGDDGEDFTIMQGNGGWNDVAQQSGPYIYLYEEPYAPIQTAGLASGEDFPLGLTLNTFQVFDQAGNMDECSFRVTVDVLGSTEREEALKKELVLSPNPTNGLVTINNFASVEIQAATLFQIDGRMIRQISLEPTTANFSFETDELQPGVYLIKVQTEAGTIVKTLVRE